MSEPNTIFLQGNTDDSTSFAILNHHLAEGLRARGYHVTVFPNSPAADFRYPIDRPDIYIFQGFGFDAVSAPGRLNVFLFTYEYPRLERRFQELVGRLNHYFDLVAVPSEFVREVCRRNGVAVPIMVCPHGVDGTEFWPGAKPVRLPTRKNFRFVNLGGFTDRKGTDVLLRAYLAEFRAEEDVCLVIKVRGYELERPWAERVLARSARERRGAAEVLLYDEDVPSVAGYYTAADVGVFPHRGEGFGLPILECLACGRPVIVTKGTGHMDFCTAGNAQFVRATRKVSRGRDMLEPDIAHLRRLMREAFERGKPSAQARETTSLSVRSFTWDRWVDLLDAGLRRGWDERMRRSVARPAGSRKVVFSFYSRGSSGLHKCVSKVDRYLQKHYESCCAEGFQDRPVAGTPGLVIGQSGYALEAFLRARGAGRILLAETGSLDACVQLVNRERRRCGLRPISQTPMELWRGRMERDLADCVVVSSNAARNHLLRSGCGQAKIRVLPWGIDARQCSARRNPATIRFLFAATDPCRKGIRVLFEAWDRLRPKRAELWCIIDEQVLQSSLLVGLLVRNPTITVRPLVSYREFLAICREADCLVLPSFEDTFSLSTGDGMGFGKPAIVSDATGISDLISHGTNGLIVKTGSVDQLSNAMQFFCEGPRRMREMGEAACETAKEWSWDRFGRGLAELSDSYLK